MSLKYNYEIMRALRSEIQCKKLHANYEVVEAMGKNI